MAGRLRGQAKKLEAIKLAADALYDLISAAAPKGLVTPETMLHRAVEGELPDRKAELWHGMLDAAQKCEVAAMDLEDMLQERIDRLPTYRPPAASEVVANWAVPASDPVEGGEPPDTRADP